MKKEERQVHPGDLLARNDESQTSQAKGHKQHQERVVCNEVQIHCQKPSADQVTFSLPDACTLSSSPPYELISITLTIISANQVIYMLAQGMSSSETATRQENPC